MSFWYSDQERNLQSVKKKHMHDVLDYNLQEMENKRNKKQQDRYNFQHYSRRLNNQALNVLLEQNKKVQRFRNQQKHTLKETYEKQIRQKMEKERLEKMKDFDYAKKYREQLQYEQARRLLQIEKMFNRVSYRGVQSHQRSKTEAQETDYRYERSNPQRYLSSAEQNGRRPNLNNLEVPSLPQYHEPEGKRLSYQQVPQERQNVINYSFSGEKNK